MVARASIVRAAIAATAAALAGCGGGGDEPVSHLPPSHLSGSHLPPATVAPPVAAATTGAAAPAPLPATAAAAAQRCGAPVAAAAAAPAPAGGTPLPAWQLTVQPADARVAPGEAASFHVRAEGGSGAFEYQWLRDGEPIESATASQYGFVTTLDDGGATFSVRVRPRGAGPGHERESAPATLAWRDG